jgi:hypothetical protein
MAITLTQKDLDAIKDLIGVTIDEVLDQKLEEKLKHLLSKEEFFSRMDDVMKELKVIREEQVIISHRVSGHENSDQRQSV